MSLSGGRKDNPEEYPCGSLFYPLWTAIIRTIVKGGINMWTREGLKSNAKEVLRASYWTAFVAALVLGFADSRAGGFQFEFKTIDFNISLDLSELVDPSTFPVLFMSFFSLTFLIATVSLVFLMQPLEVGCRRFFLEGTQLRFNLWEIGYSFRRGRYKNIVLTLFVRRVLIFAASLLLVIPGIVLSYAYTAVPYILAENPSIPYNRALQLSREMTRGHKLNIWVLDLSFLGWILLGMLACGIGVLFVQPYIHATHAQLYLALRTEALDKGLTSLEELSPPVVE